MAEIGNLAVRLGLDNKDFKKGIADAKGQTKNLQTSFAKISGAVGLAFGTEALISFGKEAVKLAAKAEGVRAAFKRLNNETLLQDLRVATRGTVSDLALMQRAVQAKNFKIPLEQLATYLKFAQQRATETGESVDYLVNSIITGIGRKSPLILDNLGISAAELSEEFQRVGDFGEAAGNIIAKEMENAGEVIDTTATKIERMNAAWENTKEVVGQGLISAFYYLKQAYDAVDDPALFAAMKAALEAAEDQRKANQVGQGPHPFMPPNVFGDLEESKVTLASLNAELKSLKELKLNAAESEIASYNIQIKNLEERIERMNNLGLGKSTLTPGTAQTLQGRGVTPEAVGAPEIDSSRIEGVNAALAQTNQWGNQLAMTFSGISEVFVNLGNVMTQFSGEFLTGFAEDIGDALSGVGSFGDDILNAMAGFMGAFGKQLIALGVAKMGLDQLFKAGPVGAAVAIGAGVALVAASRALSNSAAKSVASIGSGGGSFSSGGGGTVGMRQQPLDQRIIIEGKIRGRDIVFAQVKESYRNQRGG